MQRPGWETDQLRTRNPHIHSPIGYLQYRLRLSSRSIWRALHLRTSRGQSTPVSHSTMIEVGWYILTRSQHITMHAGWTWSSFIQLRIEPSWRRGYVKKKGKRLSRIEKSKKEKGSLSKRNPKKRQKRRRRRSKRDWRKVYGPIRWRSRLRRWSWTPEAESQSGITEQ